MTKSLIAAAALAVLAPAGLAAAQSIDGSLDASYGGPLFVQNTPTGFGDNTDPAVLTANGSEIAGVFANISGGNLNLLVTGNAETNFNRLVLFFDTVAGGDNVVGTTSTSSPGPLASYNGLTFDSGFTADQFLVVNGGGTAPGTQFFADFATIGGTRTFIGQTDGTSNTATFDNGIVFGVNNSNVDGVTETSAAGAGAVTTGLEFAIPLSVLGNPTGNIDVAGFIAGGDFLSNQVIGGVDGAANLGTASGVNFANIAGDQFVTVVVPEPASLALAGLAGLTLLRRKRA